MLDLRINSYATNNAKIPKIGLEVDNIHKATIITAILPTGVSINSARLIGVLYPIIK